MKTLKTTIKAWKESASLIVLSQKQAPAVAHHFNYEVLALKRSTGSSFMPNAIVFPGGMFEAPDCGSDWLDLYEKMGMKSKMNSISSKYNTSFIFTRNSTEALEREVSLRICAIRETFEEVGILLAKSQDQFLGSSNTYSAVTSGFDTRFWQKEVQANPKQFIELCKTLNVAPDIFSLKTWSNWLTPTRVGKHRFDTAFFIVCLQNRPELEMDEKEVQHVLWSDPRELLDANVKTTIWLPPPQNYELCRLDKVQNLDKLAKYVDWRNQFGISLTYPYQYRASDKLVHVLPGDDLYPKEPEFYDKNADYEVFSDKTAEELRKMSKKLHRTEHESLSEATIIVNTKPEHNHLCPLGIHSKVDDFATQAKL